MSKPSKSVDNFRRWNILLITLNGLVWGAVITVAAMLFVPLPLLLPIFAAAVPVIVLGSMILGGFNPFSYAFNRFKNIGKSGSVVSEEDRFAQTNKQNIDPKLEADTDNNIVPNPVIGSLPYVSSDVDLLKKSRPNPEEAPELSEYDKNKVNYLSKLPLPGTEPTKHGSVRVVSHGDPSILTRRESVPALLFNQGIKKPPVAQMTRSPRLPNYVISVRQGFTGGGMEAVCLAQSQTPVVKEEGLNRDGTLFGLPGMGRPKTEVVTDSSDQSFKPTPQ